MNGKTHQLVGMTGSLLASTALYNSDILGVPACIALIAGSALGSYLPDIDHTGSVAGRRIAIVSYPIKGISNIFSWLYRKTKLKFFDSLSEMFAHRGIFHAPLFWTLIFSLLFIYIPPVVAPMVYEVVLGLMIGVAVGVALHLGADMLNPTGIPVFMPLSNKKISLGKIVTGSGTEGIFKAVVILSMIVSAIIFIATVVP